MIAGRTGTIAEAQMYLTFETHIPVFHNQFHGESNDHGVR